MTGKQNIVFWIGLLLVLAQFWVSGQSQVFWSAVSKKTGNTGNIGNPNTKLGLNPRGSLAPQHKKNIT